MPDLDVERVAAMQREYALATHAITSATQVALAAIQAIDDHSKSPAIAAMMHDKETAGGN